MKLVIIDQLLEIVFLKLFINNFKTKICLVLKTRNQSSTICILTNFWFGGEEQQFIYFSLVSFNMLFFLNVLFSI